MSTSISIHNCHGLKAKSQSFGDFTTLRLEIETPDNVLRDEVNLFFYAEMPTTLAAALAQAINTVVAEHLGHDEEPRPTAEIDPNVPF